MSSTIGRMRPPWTRHGANARAMVAILFAGLSISACQDSAGPEQLESLTLTAPATTVQPTAVVQLTTIGTRAGQNVTNLLGQTYVVTSGGGSVSATGAFTAPSTPGTSTITVTCGGRTANVTITVVAGPLARIDVTPDPATLPILATQQFTAIGYDAFDNVVAITPVWSSTTPPGTIDASSGMFTAGLTIGTFPGSVTATSGSISGSATVTITVGPTASISVMPNPVTLGIGTQQQFTAVGHDAGGNIVPLNPIWTTTSPPGSIDAATGVFTAGNTLGTFAESVTATEGSISGTATVTVVAGPLASITVTPNPVTLAIGAQQQFTAVGRDAGGNQVPVTAVWTTTNPPGSIDAATGLFTAGNTLGTFAESVTATSGSISGTATVTVVAGPLASIIVTPDPVTLAIGEQQQFTAEGRDANGNEVPINEVWSTTNPPGSIDASTGLFTAGNTLGTYAESVTATSGSISGTATVTVIAGPLASITVTPNPVTVETTEQQLFTAVGRDGGGNVVPIVPVWSTSNPPGTINAATGLFTAGNTTGVFSNSVRATSGTIFGTATVTVTAPVVIPPPLPAAGTRMIARVAWTCTNGSITGDVATNQAAGEVPPGSVTQTLCPITGTTDIGSPTAKQAYTDFLATYAVRETAACGTTLTGTLAGVILGPGVYCFDNAAALTGTLTLSGTATDQWLFKIGAAGIPGALTTNNFDVVMAGAASPCNVTWWVRQAATMTTSNFQGHILAGAGISFTGGTFKGNAWSQEDVAVTGTVVAACDAP